MVVTVRLFAMLREQAGRGSLEMELADGATVREALDAIGERHGLDELIARMPVVTAVNREYVGAASRLSEGDELALIPPVSGGGHAGSALRRRLTRGSMELVGEPCSAPARVREAARRSAAARRARPRAVRVPAGEELLNPAGVVQGGFITAMLDETMGPAALSGARSGSTVPTLELKVSFLRPVSPAR